MCGIAGKINWGVSPGTDTVSRMCDKMAHRGPDASGVVCLDNITLGHRRLSIIDLSDNASQPMVSADGRYHIVYNGEVYNFKDLKKELELAGCRFKSHSDTEVVLNSYIQWGEACLNRFNGMFAFAVWDKDLKKLFLARDRFGQKPLYYYITPERGIVFASELSALVVDKDVPKNVSYRALNCYLTLGYILSPLTLYKDVSKLEPATYMTLSGPDGKMMKTRYWDYADGFAAKTTGNETGIQTTVLSLLEDATKRRMVSDVPIGAFLSGGVDSSSVVSIMKKYHEGTLHTFSMGFDEADYNELTDADRTAEWIGTEHHSRICALDVDGCIADDAIEAYDEPFADNSLIPTFELAKLTSGYVKVALSGDGADEIFAGYMTYKADKYYRFAKVLPRTVKKLLSRSGNGSFGKEQKKIGWNYKRKQFFYGAMYPPEKAHYLWRIFFRPEERVSILGESFRELVYDTDPFHIFSGYYERVKDFHWLDRNLYVDGMTWLPDDILVKVDRASMRNSIEVRCPYLDVDLVSYVASISPELKMKGLRTKYILKNALKDVLPRFTLKKAKSGFNAPVGALTGYDRGDEFKAFNRYVFDRKVAGHFVI